MYVNIMHTSTCTLLTSYTFPFQVAAFSHDLLNKMA